MSFVLDPEKWAQIEDLPLPKGVGNVKMGLCAVARIVYACTGEVSDAAEATCIAPTLRSYLIRLNDALPTAVLRGRIGTREIAERVLAADTSQAAEQRRAYMCADAAVRTFAVHALRAAKLDEQAAALASLSPITDSATARAAEAAEAAARAAEAAEAAARAARAAEAAAWAARAAEAAARAAEAAGAAAGAAWEPAFELLDALLAA